MADENTIRRLAGTQLSGGERTTEEYGVEALQSKWLLSPRPPWNKLMGAEKTCSADVSEKAKRASPPSLVFRPILPPLSEVVLDPDPDQPLLLPSYPRPHSPELPALPQISGMKAIETRQSLLALLVLHRLPGMLLEKEEEEEVEKHSKWALLQELCC